VLLAFKLVVGELKVNAPIFSTFVISSFPIVVNYLVVSLLAISLLTTVIPPLFALGSVLIALIWTNPNIAVTSSRLLPARAANPMKTFGTYSSALSIVQFVSPFRHYYGHPWDRTPWMCYSVSSCASIAVPRRWLPGVFAALPTTATIDTSRAQMVHSILPKYVVDLNWPPSVPAVNRSLSPANSFVQLPKPDRDLSNFFLFFVLRLLFSPPASTFSLMLIKLLILFFFLSVHLGWRVGK
jgi:hypothetical protein